MTTLAEHILVKWTNSLTAEERAQMDEFANQILTAVKWFRDAAEVVGNAMAQGIGKVEADHERSELLRLYRLRHSWKKADVARISTYRLNKSARNRVLDLATTKLRGRGTTVAFLPLSKKLALAGRYYVELHAPSTPPHTRLRLLKQHSSWWPQFVAMTYRGEYQRLKDAGVRSAAEAAERAVGDVFAISPAYVRLLCSDVRKDPAWRNSRSAPAAMTVSQFENWKVTGNLPDNYDGEVVK